MDNIWIIGTAIVIFSVVIFIYWKLTIGAFKSEFGEKRRKIWGQRTFYWQEAIIVSSGITFLFMLLLKWGNILTV